MNKDSATTLLVSHFKCFQRLILVDCIGEARKYLLLPKKNYKQNNTVIEDKTGNQSEI